MGSPDADPPDDGGKREPPDAGPGDEPPNDGVEPGTRDAEPGEEPPDIRGGEVSGRIRAFASEKPMAAVVLITAAALLVRLVLLGDRIAHFDEGRVGWWAINYMNTGQINYRFIIHGPLVQHVSRWLFEIAGANDYTMRLPVAIIGGLLPLSVFLYREHLRDAELVGVAFFLAFNPVLVYYSRFYRSTLPVAAFGFVAFGLLVRFYDTREPRYVHGAAAVAALILAAKENAIAYYITWIGAGGVVVYHVMFRRSGPAVLGEAWERYVRTYLFTRSALVSLVGAVSTGALFLAFLALGNAFPSTAFEPIAYLAVAGFVGLAIYYGVFTERGGYGILGHVLLALVIFLGVAFFFYAPRAGNTAGPGLWKTVAYLRLAFVDLFTAFTTDGFSTFFASVGNLIDATFDDFIRGYEYWLGGTGETDSYGDYLGRFLETIGEYAGAILVLSAVGAAVELFGTRRTRYVVVAVFAWGFVSIFTYPLGTDIYGGWITVNAVLPLALPAGVGLGLFYEWLERGWHGSASGDTDLVVVGTVLVVFLVVVGAVGVGLATGVYTNDQARENTLVQYAQPGGDMRPAIKDMRAAAEGNEGTDVLFYGSGLVRETPRTGRLYPRCLNIGDGLPLHWYVNVTGSTADCAHNRTALEGAASGAQRPMVVIAKASQEEYLDTQFPNYHSRTYLLRTFGDRVVFLVHPRYANSTR
jgi:uncharacterized protein (TIGR03663 family)